MSQQALPLNSLRPALSRVYQPALRTPYCVRAQAASTSSRQKEATETLEREPSASADTTHVEVDLIPPTEPEHTSNGSPTKTEIEIDSVLATELSENGEPNMV